MKVDPAGNRPVRLTVPDAPSRPSPRETASPRLSTPGGVPGRLAEALREAGADVSPSRLLALAADLEALGVPLSRITPETALRALFLSNNAVPLSPELLAEPPGQAAPFFQGVDALRDAAHALLADRRITGTIRDAVAALARDLDALSMAAPLPSGSVTAADGETPIPAGTAMSALLDDPGALLSSAGSAPGTALAEGVGSLMRRSGVMFEWRLLAWYRAGADPGRLADLVRGDLKGALLGFLAAMETLRGKGRAPGGLKTLEEGSRSLLDRITAGQISHLADNSGERRNLVLNLPFGTGPERMYAGVKAEGRSEPGGDRLDTEHYSLAFEIETSDLGLVRVHLMMSGKTVSAAVYLRDEEAKALAEEMAGDFRAFLAGRGYEPGSIRFGVGADDRESDVTGGRRRRAVNVRG